MVLYWFLYSVFMVTSMAMILWGTRREDRFLQYPTLAGMSWLVFFGPQVFGSIVNARKYPQSVLDDGGLIIALVMLCVCAGAGWLGYYHAGKRKNRWSFPQLSEQKVFKAGIVLYAIGFMGAYKLAELTGGFADQFSGGGHYALSWEGAPVRYAFISGLIYPGLALALISLVRRFSHTKLAVCMLMMLYPLAVALFLGRRTRIAMLAGTVLLALFFTKRIRIPKLVQVSALVAVFLVVYYGPAYRNASQHGLNYSEIASSISEYDHVRQMITGEKYSEFDVMVFWGAAINRRMAFSYGADIYNNLIVMYVPRQIIGATLKSSLLIPPVAEDPRELAIRFYDWEPQYGWFLTGPYTAFRQFWFLGGLFYYAMGYGFRRLWEAAFDRSNLVAQIWYISTVVLVPLSIMSSITSIPARLLYTLAVLWPITRFCAIPLRSGRELPVRARRPNGFRAVRPDVLEGAATGGR